MKTRQVGVLIASALVVSLFGCEGSRLGGPGRDVGVLTDTTEDVDASEVLDDATDVAEVDDDTSDTGDVGPDVFVPDPEWEAVSLGDVGDVGGLSIVSPTEAYVASGTRVLRFNGTTWAAFGSPDVERAVHGVWSDGVVVVAVGEGGLIARRTLAGGGGWTMDTNADTNDLWAIAGRDADDLTAVGDGGVVLRSSESGWQKMHERASLRLRGVYMDPETEGDAGVYAVGSNGQLVESVGGVWRGAQIAASASTLSGFAKLEDGTLLAVGTAHTVTAKRPNSPAWQGETTNDTRERDIRTLVVGADGVVRAFGAEGLVMKRSGLSWSVDAGPGAVVGVKNFGAAGVFGTGASAGIIVVADEGGGVIYRNGAWASMSTALDATVTSLAEGPDGKLWASAGGGVVMARVAGDWTVIPLPFQTNLNAVAADAEGGAWAVGAEGRVIHIRADFSVEAVPVAVPVEFFGVSVDAGTTHICGRGGTFFSITRDDDDWVITARATSTVADLRDVLVDNGSIWVVGAFGTLLKGPVAGGAFVPVATGTGGSLHAIDAGGAGIFASGDNGVIVRIAGDSATIEHELPGVFLFGLAVADDSVVAAGSAGTIVVRSNGEPATWTAEVPAIRSATFESALVDSSGQAWLGSNRRDASLERRLVLFESGAE